MISREILKKQIRRVEIRNDRLVTETLPDLLNAEARGLNREIRKMGENREAFFGFGSFAYFVWFADKS